MKAIEYRVTSYQNPTLVYQVFYNYEDAEDFALNIGSLEELIIVKVYLG